MKRILLITLCFATQIAFSQTALPTISIKNFTGSYADPEGSATADYFLYEETEFKTNSEFLMFKQAGVFFLKTPDDEIELDKMPEQINELRDLSFSGINIETNSKLISVSIPKLRGTTVDKKVELENFSLTCSGDFSDSEAKEAVLDICFNKKGSVDLDKFDSGKDQMRYLSVDVVNNKLNFRAKVSGVTAKGWGTSQYIASENKIVLKINKVKVGILNVTGKFFGELSKQENESVIVNRPYIEILLD